MNNLHGWQWRKIQGNIYLTCNLLSSWRHGFFTKAFYPQTPEKLVNILQPETEVYRVKQVHGNTVLTPKEINHAIDTQDLACSFPDADGIVSDRLQQSVWVASADCTPILIGDRQTGRVCAIHAGWRGTSQEIVKKAIARMLDFGSKKENLRVAIGPAIAGEVYQVDEYVALEVGKTILSQAVSQSDGEILQKLKQMPNAPILEDKLAGKVRLNVSRVNQIQVEQLDIAPANIAIAPVCTYQQSDILFSYRRTGERKVQWSGIVSNEQ